MAATKYNGTNWLAALKIFYVDSKKIQDMAEMEDLPLLGLVRKNPGTSTKAGGASWNYPILSAAPAAAVGAGYPSGSTIYSAPTARAFASDWKDMWAFVGFTEKVMAQSQNAPKDAFLNVVQESKRVIDRFNKVLEYRMYRNESGSIGQLSAAAANTASFTAATANAAWILEENEQVVVGSTASPAANLRGGDKVVTIDKVEREAGKAGAAVGWPASNAANDHVFYLQDAQYAKAESKPPCVAGLSDWIPDTAPVDTWKGVNRAVDPDRLGGLRMAGSANDVKQSIISAINRLSKYNGKPTHVIIHPDKMTTLVNSMGDNPNWVRLDGSSFTVRGATAQFGFAALKVAAAGRIVDVVAAPACPPERGYVLNLGTFELQSMGTVPDVRSRDGLKMLRDTADGYQMDFVAFLELMCGAPGHNLVIKFDA